MSTECKQFSKCFSYRQIWSHFELCFNSHSTQSVCTLSQSQSAYLSDHGNSHLCPIALPCICQILAEIWIASNTLVLAIASLLLFDRLFSQSTKTQLCLPPSVPWFFQLLFQVQIRTLATSFSSINFSTWQTFYTFSADPRTLRLLFLVFL